MGIFDRFKSKNKMTQNEKKINEGTDLKEKYERLLNDVYPGVTMYVRDVDLPPVCAEKYRAGMIIKERGFTDASMRIMGMKTTYRFAILSNHMADLSTFEHGTIGDCVLHREVLILKFWMCINTKEKRKFFSCIYRMTLDGKSL